MSKPVFARTAKGEIEVHLGENEVNVVHNVALDLLTELDAPGEHSVRWFPPAYSDDPTRQEEFARMTRDDLVETKRAAIHALVASIERGSTRRGVWRATLSDDDANVWLGVLNDARLYLGTRLNVTEDLDHAPRTDDDPEAQLHNLYLFLSSLQGLLLEEMLDEAVPG